MTSGASTKPASDIRQALYARSDALRSLRNTITLFNGFEGAIASAASFKLVVDTNIVLGDLIWLVSTRRDPTAKTALMEIVEAATVEAFVPPLLLDEVSEKIPLIAAERGLDLYLLQAEWQSYQKMLKVEYPDPAKVEALKAGQDPDDADFIALAQTIMAAGIASKDTDISKMGGNTVSIECIASLRSYSREVVVELNIKVNGMIFTLIGLKAIGLLFTAMRTLTIRLASTPDWVKVVSLLSLTYVLLNPHLRSRIGQLIQPAFFSFRDMVPSLLEIISSAAEEAENRKIAAEKHLADAKRELNSAGAEVSV